MHQYTGALRLTYAILMGKEGAYSDRNNDGVLNEGEETLILAKPCILWREFTQNRYYWYGESTLFAPKCQELARKSLTN